MWHKGWREEIWSNIQQDWDLIIVGGGITGAGVLRMAVNAGLKVLLVEMGDFSSGTSSRSSKLVHGGFRYLREGQVNVTKESVREREWMRKAAPHLVTNLGFFLADYKSFHIPMSVFRTGVVIYDLLAPKWDHCQLSKAKFLRSLPGLREDGLLGGFHYCDAEMDDARVVLRLLRESVRGGGTALSYAKAEQLLRTKDGRVCGVILRDQESQNGRTVEIKAKVVVNACGPWSDELRQQVGAKAHIRKLRGSHLIFSQERWPLPAAGTLVHPKDHRALFVIPWEGTSMIGTTDLDHSSDFEAQHSEPFASQEEIDYLLEALNFLFPSVKASQADIISTFAGIRPTLNPDGETNPSHVSRAHAIFEEQGMITITGGKFTTFRIMARQTMQAVFAQLGRSAAGYDKIIFGPLEKPDIKIDALARYLYLQGRHGFETEQMIASAQPSELEKIAPLANTWAEVRWAAREEGVQRLDDLLLRRVRLGMLLSNGARELLPQIRKIAQTELGWDDKRWEAEEKSYLETWKRYYGPNPG